VHPSLTGAKILARAFVVACLLITAIPCAMAAGKLGKAGCERLRAVKIPNAQITSIEFVTSGSLTPAGAFNLRGEQVVLKDLPRFCKVMGTSRPSADSEIGFEVWDDPHGKTVRARPLCVYPAIAKWTGKDPSDDPTNFVCADP
jgi:hypothetical protein